MRFNQRKDDFMEINLHLHNDKEMEFFAGFLMQCAENARKEYAAREELIRKGVPTGFLGQTFPNSGIAG